MKNQRVDSAALESRRIVIVGGVAGGATAAARARRVNANAEITILEQGPAVSFANCGLPYHLGGEIAQRQKLLVATPELFWERFRVRVCLRHRVERIDRATQTVHGVDADGRLFERPYDKLILATGSQPLRPDFWTAESENVFQLWTLTDLDRILEYLRRVPCRTATVVGAGFVGLEVVEQLARLGLAVDLVERAPQVLGPLDEDMAHWVQAELQRHQIRVWVDRQIETLVTAPTTASPAVGPTTESPRVQQVRLAGGPALETDLVIVGAGVRPRTELAVAAGLSLGPNGGVAINANCQTSDPHIYAVGDMVEYQHGTLETATRMPLAGPANRAGRVAGGHAAGGAGSGLAPVQGTSIVRVFELAAGVTGLNERTCQRQGIPYRTAVIQAGHHASYFPGAKNLILKLVYSPESGRVLGLQAVGEEGVDKRLDVVATLLHFRGTVDDLAGLDLAYAPPFGSAKDPLHMAAFVAQNDLAERPILVSPNTELLGFQVVDVRNPDEIERRPLAGAIAVPVDEIPQRWSELDARRPTIVVCQSGKRGHVAACWLQGKGFDSVANLRGGLAFRRIDAEK